MFFVLFYAFGDDIVSKFTWEESEFLFPSNVARNLCTKNEKRVRVTPLWLFLKNESSFFTYDAAMSPWRTFASRSNDIFELKYCVVHNLVSSCPRPNLNFMLQSCMDETTCRCHTLCYNHAWMKQHVDAISIEIFWITS